MVTLLRLSRVGLLLILLLSFMLGGCGEATKTPEISDIKTSNDEREIQPTQPTCLVEEASGQDLVDNLFSGVTFNDAGISVGEVRGYIQDQFVVTGLSEQINKLEELFFLQYGAYPDELIDMEDFFNSSTDLGGYTIRLYALPLGLDESIEDILIEVLDLVDVNDLGVIPELNFVIGAPDDSIGTPGSPPIEGGPASPPAGSLDSVIEFAGQWAVLDGSEGNSGGIGLRKLSGNVLERATGNLTGQNVTVAIFDSTPFTDTVTVDVTNSVIPYTMCNYNLIYTGTIQRTPAEKARSASDLSMNNHGLFVSSLAQTVAPASEYHLIQVLNEQMYGSSVILLNAVHKFYQGWKVVHPGENERLVINMSLGFEINSASEFPLSFNNANDVIKNTINLALQDDMKKIGLETDEGGLTNPLVFLQVFMKRLNELNVVSVASAGNQGNGIPALYPARFEGVIGVESNTISGENSCFSNDDTISAPSGNGTDASPCQVDLGIQCANVNLSGLTIPVCKDAVVGIVLSSDTNDYKYAYWTGTSFSAPFVTGLAALILDKNPTLTPTEVQSYILNNQVNGVVNVPGVLAAVPTP